MDPELSIIKYHPTGGMDIDLIQTIIAALSESQLCGLSDDEEEEIQELNTGRTASKRRREEDGDQEPRSQTEELAATLKEVLASQRREFVNSTQQMDSNSAKIIMDLLKKQEESNKLTVKLVEMQSMKRADEEYTREEAIKFAFEAGEDDAENIIAHDVRTGLRPVRGDWVKRWKSLGRYAKPRREDLGISQVGTLSLSPVVIRSMHDRGKDLKLSMFLHVNQDVAMRSGKVRKVGQEGCDVVFEHYDWKEAETVHSVSEAVLAYLIALWRIWPEDWSGMVLLKILFRYKFLANANVNMKSQLFVLNSFANAFFSRCAAAGRDMRPPPVWRDAEALMHEVLDKNGIDHTQCKMGRDPYLARQLNNPQFQHNNLPPTQGQGTGNNQRRNNSSRNNNKQWNSDDLSRAPLSQMSLAQKQAVICRDYNAGICSKSNCKFRHRCNVVTSGDRVCYSNDHAAKDHK